jgi:hypothetical protein
MRLTMIQWVRLTCAAAAIAPVPAWADFLYFKDYDPTKITVVANLFLGAPLTLDDRIIMNKHPFRNQFKAMPKSKRITFKGTDSNFATPYNFSTDYIFVSKKDVHVPLAELSVTGVATGVESEAITGTYRGFGDPTLPDKIPEGATVLVIGRHSIGIQFGQTAQSITIGVQAQYTR